LLVSLSSGSAEKGAHREDRERLQLACAACGNHCRVPGSSTRAYACPRCGHPLPLSHARASTSPPRRRRLGALSGTRALLIGTLVTASMALAIHAGLASYRAASSESATSRPRAPLVRLTAAEERNYAFRERQLEEDLRRDAGDFEVLVRLGHLNLQLAECWAQDRGSHLRRARNYLLLAATHSMSRGDAFHVHALLDAANAPNPRFILVNLPGEVGPPPREDESWIRLRLGWLEDEVSFHPTDSRWLRRLGDTYLALYSVMGPRGGGPIAPSEEGAPISDPREARQRAAAYYRRAIETARTHEALCRALYREAEMYRVINEPSRAAALLERLLTIQPNNWLVSLETAALYRQLGQPGKADRYQALSARWRTPDWI
jgi:tetratricopeptide (TPR) repeat protein